MRIMFAQFCEYIQDKWKWIMWYWGFAPMEAYFVSMNEYTYPVKIRLSKKDYLTAGRKLRDAIYFVAMEYNPGEDDSLWWPKQAVLRVRPDYDRLRKGDYVVLCDDQDRIRIAQVKSSGYPSLPDIFDGGELVGITHDIVGKVIDRF